MRIPRPSLNLKPKNNYKDRGRATVPCYFCYMPKVHLLNSAIMPQEGYYSLKQYDKINWTERLKEAIGQGFDKRHFQHYIGYETTLAYVENLTGIEMNGTNKDKTSLKNGDYLFVIRLGYRVDSSEKREDNPDIDKYEFFIGRYWEASSNVE